jgi:hypothetical protein
MDEPPVDLERLVRWVNRRTRNCDEFDRLALAAKVAAHLAQSGDRLVGHFVEEARAEGASWAQIGAHLGVTKQAAQQRHGAIREGRGRLRPGRAGRRAGGREGMFDRFTAEGRQAVVVAQREGAPLGHNYLGTEHLLLGVLAGDGTGGRVLADLGVRLGPAREALESIIGRGPEPVAGGAIPFTPRTKRVLQMAAKNARSHGRDLAGTGTLLLALLEEGEGVAVQILERLGADDTELRTRLTSALVDEDR